MQIESHTKAKARLSCVVDVLTIFVQSCVCILEDYILTRECTGPYSTLQDNFKVKQKIFFFKSLKANRIPVMIYMISSQSKFELIRRSFKPPKVAFFVWLHPL